MQIKLETNNRCRTIKAIRSLQYNYDNEVKLAVYINYGDMASKSAKTNCVY